MRRTSRCPGTALAVFLLGLGAGSRSLAASAPATAGFSVVVTPADVIDASTWNSGSFAVTNRSTAGERITRLRFDLRSAVLPDLVFDPLGTGGDQVAKCLTADDGAARTGFSPPADPCVVPFSSPHDGGYDVMQIDFTDFAPGETFSFSVDIDPTTIRGAVAPGPGEAGSVSGLELSGATVEATYAGGGVLTAQLLRSPGSASGSEVTAPAQATLPSPALAVPGVASPPATVASPAQTVRVGGPPGAAVRLVRIEAALWTAGLAGEGFDVDPFEANGAVAVDESAATLDASGTANIPVTLTRSGGDAGLNSFVAAFVDASGRTGPVSEPLVLVPEDCSAPPPRSMTLTMTATTVDWTPLPGATAYDLVRGDVLALRSSRGDFTSATTACLADNWPGTNLNDASNPPPGGGWFYVARGVSCGGNGTYDSDGFGLVASRDPGVNQSPAGCP